MRRKGIILAGGSGTRLHPSTISVSKQLMPVYDKPMIYYPLCVLMDAGIREILVITTPEHEGAFRNLLQDGTRWGLSISYATQPTPDGIAQALIIAEDFLDGAPSALILGDNLFFGTAFNAKVTAAKQEIKGATIFGYRVKNPSRYGVIGFDAEMSVISLTEKPEKPESDYAVAGLYFYDNQASQFAKTLCPSARGELEITALNALYLARGALHVQFLDDSTTWLDTGTHASLLRAAQFVSVIEERQGIRICCPEETAYRQGWIDRAEFQALIAPLRKSGYGQYLETILDKM